MRLAFVHDWLIDRGGAENVLAAMVEVFPEAPIYALFHDPNGSAHTLFAGRSIHVSFLQRVPTVTKRYRNFLPFLPLAVEQFDLSDFDLILSSSHAVAKGVLTSGEQLHVCYLHSPPRYAWDLQGQYLKEAGLLRGPRSLLVRVVLHYLRLWDACAAQRVDEFMVNSQFVARRVAKFYRRSATVIYPPVEVDAFEVEVKKENFYLCVSRLVPYKKVNLIIEAFAALPHQKLFIIGDGPDREKLTAQAGTNVEILGYQPQERLREYLQKAKGFIYAAVEDFGIAVVEAQACGTPVIAYGRGGALETVVEGKTGLFFPEQSPSSLVRAIEKFENCRELFEPYTLRAHAEKFSRTRFQQEFRRFVEAAWDSFENRKH